MGRLRWAGRRNPGGEAHAHTVARMGAGSHDRSPSCPAMSKKRKPPPYKEGEGLVNLTYEISDSIYQEKELVNL